MSLLLVSKCALICFFDFPVGALKSHTKLALIPTFICQSDVSDICDTDIEELVCLDYGLIVFVK